MKYRFYDIKWDTYDEETEQAPNQTEIGLPSEVIVDWDDDEEDIADTGLDERVQRIENHRSIVDRQKLFREDGCEREEPRAGTTGEDDAFHAFFVIESSRCYKKEHPARLVS